MQEISEAILQKPEPASWVDRLHSSEPMRRTLSLQPTAAYLTLAHLSSVRVAHPEIPRKLLVLDLNGTLLVRPKKSRLARFRPVYPRPFMPSFRAYLFHETVKPWLEVMIWSSAQPHSVDDMVKRCFQDQECDLKAIWARDTLGLDVADYSRKVQTIKDLEKPWSALSDPLSPHTAKTTLLVDDSARKAHLQPYNHLCIPEYTQNLLNRDLRLTETIARDQQAEAQEAQQVHLASLAPVSETVNHTKSKSKRERPEEHTAFDPTLIAVMGVLDEIKEQTNVASWVRAGGLWAGYDPPSGRGSLELFSDDDRSGYGSDLSAPDDRRHKRPRVERIEAEDRLLSNPGNDATIQEDKIMWYDYEPCFQYWIERGKHAVDALGIKLDHGVVR